MFIYVQDIQTDIHAVDKSLCWPRFDKLYIDKVGQESCTKTWLNGTAKYIALGSGTVPPKMEWLMNAGDKLSKVGRRDTTVKFNTVLPLAGGMVGTYVRTCVCDVRTGSCMGELTA